MNNALEAKYLLLGYEFGPIPEYGTKMSLEHLKDMCSGYGYLSGHGFYSFRDKITTIPITGKMVKKGLINKDFIEVVWFVDN